jgi:hypothetical protein
MEEVLRLMRLMDETLGGESRHRRERVLAAYSISSRLWDVVTAYREERPFPWDELNEMLPVSPLAHQEQVHGILEEYGSGGIPNWCFEWMRSR